MTGPASPWTRSRSGGTTDNATNTTGWTLDGFSQLTNGQYTQSFFHYYLVESRSYIDNDASLCGAYNFLAGNWLEKQCYAGALLIWLPQLGHTPTTTPRSTRAADRSCPSMRTRRRRCCGPTARRPGATRWQIVGRHLRRRHAFGRAVSQTSAPAT